MVTTLSTQSVPHPAYAVSFVQIETAGGLVLSGYRVGPDGPIYRDFEAAERHANRRRERDERAALRLVEARRRAAETIERAMSKATQRAVGTAAVTGVTRRGVAVVGGMGNYTAEPCRVRRPFGAGLGV